MTKSEREARAAEGAGDETPPRSFLQQPKRKVARAPKRKAKR